MTIRCDHCRGSLGLDVHRYWRMRYCSAECAIAYRRRLNEETVEKIHRLKSQLDAPDVLRQTGVPSDNPAFA